MTFGGAAGDDLLCTVPVHELKVRSPNRTIAILTRHPALFKGNSDVDRVLAKNDYAIEPLLQRLGYTCIVPHYTIYDPETDRDQIPPEHILAAMCRAAGITGLVTLRPYFYLTESERAAGRLAPRQISIQSSAGGALFPMANKEWFVDRFQTVADALAPKFRIIQLGSLTDPPLSGVMDFRGKTTVREAAAILSQSVVFVGLVGFLMHLARAVECRSVIVYGGRETPSQSGYPCNINLTSSVPCAPCWRWNKCDHGKECMRSITSAHVLEGVEKAVALVGQPLETETVTL